MTNLPRKLLHWYDAHRRVLPWREDPTPYHVLLSELMLQQTRVDTVIPYFERFTTRWPTIEDFAGATEDEVLSEWAGLGYYSRARNLLKAAQQAVSQGGLTGDPEALRALPGIGPYTAGAVASIAFGTCTPIVDGNVERVLCRLDKIEEDPRKTAAKRALWARAGELVPEERAGDFNQALMELGAMVCTPRSPSCEQCPWHDDCQARAAGCQAELPKKTPKKKPVPVRGVSGILRLDGGILVAQRPRDGLLGGLWEPPSKRITDEVDPAAAIVDTFRDRVGLHVEVKARLGEVVHVFTHRRLTRTVFEVQPIGAQEPRAIEGYDAVDVLRESSTLALSKLAIKTLALGEAPPLLKGL
ncbi:MAG: A/G-specific adenine glycosylase [Myxococcota bacterium]